MNLFPALAKKYSGEPRSAVQAQRFAQEIVFGPAVFQVARIMVKWGIFAMLGETREGLSMREIMEKTGKKRYPVQVLLESSLTSGTILYRDGRFRLAKTGWFLLHDAMSRVNMDFNHDVNYLGWFSLEESLLREKPEGLKIFGDWPTIYEGLSQLPEPVRKSWFAFDHFYSDGAFPEALKIVFDRKPRTLLDVGGNTGRWAVKCVEYDPDVKVTVMDLPQQLTMMRTQTASHPEADRVDGCPADLLDASVPFPAGFDVIWMSQFLDCFSEAEATDILSRAACSMTGDSRLFVMETLWDRQKFEQAGFCLAQISLYFTALANGCSKMFHSEDLFHCVRTAGLEVVRIHDGLGLGHSLVECRKRN